MACKLNAVIARPLIPVFGAALKNFYRITRAVLSLIPNVADELLSSNLLVAITSWNRRLLKLLVGLFLDKHEGDLDSALPDRTVNRLAEHVE